MLIYINFSFDLLGLGPVYMIPARRDGMLTEILLVIQILKSVYMIPPLIPPRRDLGNRMKNSHINTSSRLGGINFSHLSMRN
jgi:hypothetical protein